MDQRRYCVLGKGQASYNPKQQQTEENRMSGPQVNIDNQPFKMKIEHEVVSVDGLNRVAVFCRTDGTYGYMEFKNVGTATSPGWQESSRGDSRFGSEASALKEAHGRVAWLRREIEWPAKDFEPRSAEPYMPGWIECPKCHIRFSLTDSHRWGSGRHLTCGQRILVEGVSE